ncbi:MAG: SPFH domain-containing protein [Pirellulales bacterium]
MGFLDSLRRQLRSVIEWENPGPSELFTQWTDNGDEIKNASKLIIGPGQGCVFVYEGKVIDVFTQEGTVNLKTANIPFWTTITKVMQAFESEHKVGIYFFRTTRILDQKWGTTSPVKYDDPKYQFPVALRAFGNYSYKVIDPKSFFVTIVGGSSAFTAIDLRHVISDRILQPLSDYFAKSQFSYADIDAHREEIAVGIAKKLEDDFQKLGLEITDFRVEGTSFSDETMQRINRIADITAESAAAAAAGLTYAQLQQLEALRETARNEGGTAGAGMGVGAGIGFGQMMANAMGSFDQSATADTVTKMKNLKALLNDNLITEDEYELKKQKILDEL